jgi:hypothetical protein
MKKFYLLLATFAMVSIISAQDVLEFTEKKPIENGYSVYFHVKGILNDEHANEIVNDLANEANITYVRYFVSSQGKDRFQLSINEGVTPEYIRNILITHNTDFEFTSVSRKDQIGNKASQAMRVQDVAQRRAVNYPGFPKYEETGNTKIDEANYSANKEQWIQENPEAYQQLLNEIKVEEPVTISKQEFENFSNEKKQEILNQPDRFIIE